MVKTVVVGMSGGVDSSVTAYLLKKQGYRVIGLFMKNWEEDGTCPASVDYDDVVHICTKLDIPYYTVNFIREYQELVFSEFLSDLKKGITPNPDILCNREIKFNVFWEKAKELGADYLATGHYCRTKDGKLFKGLDPNKDQSYFLGAVKKGALENVLFPIGEMEKSEVRAIAKELGLSVHNKKDSTGICFIGKRDFKSFTSTYLGYSPGNFENTQGEMIGKHDGAAFYTIGQRKGLGIGGPGDAWFVVDKDLKRNVVLIEQGKDHPALYKKELYAIDLSWITEAPPIPYSCTAKVRYRQEDQPCTIESIRDGKAHVVFNAPGRAITPGQAIVFYNQDECLGSGKIL